MKEQKGLLIAVRVISLLVGALFVFSGFVKLVDPLGFSYKLMEYYEVFGEFKFFHKWKLLAFMHTPLFTKTSVLTSMFMSVLEVGLGYALMIGYRSKITTWTTLLLMVFFTFLTGFSAQTGEVKECGCFGNFIPLVASESYVKDLVLITLVFLIWCYRNKIKPLVPQKEALLFTTIGFVLAFSLSIYCLNHLPVFDFRAYAVGVNQCEDMQDTPGESINYYLCKHKQTGEEKEFKANFPSDYAENWDYISMRQDVIVPSIPAPISGFIVSDIDGNDRTEDLLDEGMKLLIYTYDVDKSSRKGMERVNELRKACEEQGIEVYGLSASPDETLEAFRHETNSAFEFLEMDAIEIKTVVRSNPGIVAMDGCHIVGKWHWRDTPEIDDLRELKID